MKKRIALVLVALLLGNVPALPSHAEVCEGNYCSVTFEFTGDIVQFKVPVGVSSIDFEVLGASGGRGGQGGKVTGTLTNLPQSLYVVVGSAGSIGSQVAGGYNGGGQAGGYRTNEGSGGGATDIRLDLGLDSRIVVAGGGGGGGGFSGAPGGAGGGLIAADGISGQGGGGGGGTQSAGGSAGVSNGGTSATSGRFGTGGTGGNSANAGGGGGGGGWFGGGGGGADDDTCCSDGGGGGGGSSFTDSNYVINGFHESGVQLGNGRVVFNYVKSLVITEFSAIQLDSATAQFSLGLSLETPMELAQFDLTGITCSGKTLQAQGSGYLLTVTECLDGLQSIRIADGAIDGSLPKGEIEASVEFDATAPSFEWQLAEVDHIAGTALIDYIISETALLEEQLVVKGCSDLDVLTSQIALSGCAEERVSIELLAYTLEDSWGNASPETELIQFIEFDFVQPTLTVVEVTSDESTADHSFVLLFSEPSSLDTSRILVSAAGDCSFNVEADSTSAQVVGNCGYGDVSYTVPAESLVDEVGNLGPQADFVVTFNVAKPALQQPNVPTEEPNPVQSEPDQRESVTPGAPNETPPVDPEPDTAVEPTPTEEPVLEPEPAETQDPGPEPAAEPAPTEEPVLEPEPTQSSDPEPDTSVEPAPAQEPEPEPAAEPAPIEQPLIEPESEAERPAPEAGAGDPQPQGAATSLPAIAEPERTLDTSGAAEYAQASEADSEAEVSARPSLTAEPPRSQDVSVEPATQISEQPRLDQQAIAGDSGQLSLWLITVGGAATVGATGYLVLRFIGK